MIRARDVRAEIDGILADRCVWCGKSYPVTSRSQRPFCSSGCRHTAERNGGNNTRGALDD